jgi:large subunit ribosomal protein L10
VRDPKTFLFGNPLLSRTLTIWSNETLNQWRTFMAITRDKKNTLVTELVDLFATAKGSVGAAYAGLSVADMQELRAAAREAGVVIKVVKNRLVRVALAQSDKFKAADTSLLTGQLVYAFSSDDEVAPAQVLAVFAKKHPQMQLIAGFDGTGASLNTATVKALADLPTKDQLRGQLVSVIAAPLTSFLGVANGAQRGFAQVLSQRAEQV